MTTRSFAQVVGIVFILIGAIGFFPGMKSAPLLGYLIWLLTGVMVCCWGCFPSIGSITSFTWESRPDDLTILGYHRRTLHHDGARQETEKGVRC
jgi:hypothetical protein